MKKLISLLLVLIMVISILPYPIQATEGSDLGFSESEITTESALDFIENTDDIEETSDIIYDIEDDTEILDNEIAVFGDIELSAVIPDNSESILNDLGFYDGLIADIKPIGGYSLRGNPVSYPVNVELNVSQYSDGDMVDVVHFIENSDYISDDSIILNVSKFSRKSKEILSPAIIAYQEYFGSNEDCVAIELIEDLSVSDGFISFEIDSFSIFAVGEVYLNTFEFYVEDELINTQYIIGDSSGKGVLFEPESPYKDHYEFNGWEIEDSGEYVEFGYIPVNMTSSTIIRCYADFEEVCYAYFLYEAEEGAYILETLKGKPGDIISTEHIDYPLSLDRHIISWHTDVDLKSPAVTEIEFISGQDIVLYPNVIEGAWITFYTVGGSHMDPVFYPMGESIETPEEPTKMGYTFGGWLDDEGNPFEFKGQILENSVSLTVNWIPANTNYYVQIMFERQNENGKYDAATGGLFIKQGPTGATVNGNMSTESERNNAISKIDSESVFKSNLTHYEYNAEKSQNSTTVVLGDGTSIVYVYYDLKYYTVTFDLGTNTSKKMTIGGKTYTGGSNVEKYVITAKYGDLIADKWPLAEHFEADDNFRRWQYKSGYYWVTKQHYMIGSDLINKTMTANYSTSGSIIAYYLIESLDQESPEGGSFDTQDFRKLYNGVYYDMSPIYTQEVQSTLSQWTTQKPLTGYNIVTMVKDSSVSPNAVYMYYTRTRHNLNLYNDGENVYSQSSIMYETPLTMISNSDLQSFINGAIPAYPKDYEPGTYQFVGWYNTVECYDGTDVDLKTLSIPNQDLELYAKWIPIDVHLYVHVTIDGTDKIIEGFNGFTVLYGDKVDKDRVDELIDSVNVPDEAIWYGWYEKIKIGNDTTVLVPYNFNRELIEDLVLYPFYSYIEPTSITYNLNGGSGAAPIDEFNYAVGKGAVVLSGESVIAPVNKVFIGWNTEPDGSGISYKANDIVVISDRNMVLYAEYENISNDVVELSYINTITNEIVNYSYKITDNIEILDTSIFVEPISKRYIFKEYNTKSDGSGRTFQIGDFVNLTNEDENILYAIYDEIDVTLLGIPIMKQFNNFQNGVYNFSINAVFCDEYGNEIGSDIHSLLFKYNGQNVEEYVLEVIFDADMLVDDSVYYLKVYEEEAILPIISDTNYYIVSVEVSEHIPTIVDVKQYYENGNIVSDYVYNDNLLFINLFVFDIDDLPNMGGTGYNTYRMIGLCFGIVGISVIAYIIKKRKGIK